VSTSTTLNLSIRESSAQANFKVPPS